MPLPRIGPLAGRLFSPAAVRVVLLALVLLFLAGHLPWRTAPPTDIDEANFVLAVRRYGVASHRPHPPGYPVFVALGKLARPLTALAGPAPLASGGRAAVEARALAVWAALFGAAAVVPLFRFFRAIEDRTGVALAATAFTVAAPLYWFTAGRPLSDVPGLAAVLLVDALLLEAWRRQRAAARSRAAPETTAGRPVRLVVLGAAVAGLAGGLRSQTVWLVGPLLVAILAAWPGARLRLAAAAGSAWLASVAVWLVPLVVSTGGWAPYLDVLGRQAVEDLAFVEMLARRPTADRTIQALAFTFGAPWATREMALVILTLAAVGLLTLVRRGARVGRVWCVLGVAFGPYALFHLLFQESETTRYALPLVPPVAYLAARGLAWFARGWLPLAATAIVVALGSVTLPAYGVYVRAPSPIFAALDALSARLAASPEPSVVAAHQPFWRALEVVDLRRASVISKVAGREVSDLAERWLRGEPGRAFLLNDPRKGHVRLIDPLSRQVTRFRWPFRRERFLRGIRPDEVDLIEIDDPPGWFCAEGWALTPDAGGLIGPERRAPQLAPAVAYVRRRPDAALMVVGGRHLAPRLSPRPAVLTVAIDGVAVASWTARPDPDWFLEFIPIEAGRLLGEGRFAVVTVSARGEHGIAPPVGLEQFDLQSVDRPVWAYDRGWYLREYDTRTGELWRWTSERALLRVFPGDRDLTLSIAGQSPLAERGAPPTVTVRAGNVQVAHLRPGPEFRESVRIPRGTLDAAGDVITIETDRLFVPAEWGLRHDTRRLGIRLFEVDLR